MGILQLTSLFILFYLTSCVVFPVFNGYQILDLNGISQTQLDLESSTWGSSGVLTASKTTNCGGIYILSGVGVLSYNGYFEQTYYDLPIHNILQFQIRLSIIDNWSSSDDFLLDLNGVSMTGYLTYQAQIVSSSNICGNSAIKDLQFVTLIGRISHSTSQFHLRMTSKLVTSPTIASLGMKQISLIFANTSETGSILEKCIRPFDNYVYNDPPNICQCVRGKYWNTGSSSCSPCNSNCGDCFGPGAGNCYICSPGYVFTSSNQCTQCPTLCATCSGFDTTQCLTCVAGSWLHRDQTCQSSCALSSTLRQDYSNEYRLCSTVCTATDYLLYDNTCVGSCSSPLLPVVTDGNLLCNHPCADTTYYLYANNSCYSTCPAPYQSGLTNLVKTCSHPCLSPSDYFFSYNFTCRTDCPSPLIDGSAYGVNTCQHPCVYTTDYLYDNDTCSPTCPTPYKIQQTLGIVNLCQNPCNIGEYLMYNFTCRGSCLVPLHARTQSNLEFCDICPSNLYQHSTLGTCLNTCDPPYWTESVSIMGKFCSLGLPQQEQEQVQQVIKTQETTGPVTSTGITAMSILSSSNPSASFMASLVKMLSYIRYIKINYPPKLAILLDSQDGDDFDLTFAPEMPPLWDDKFEDYPLPENFAKYELSSSFVVNMWDALFTLIIILCAIFIFWIITNLLKAYKKLKIVHAFSNKVFEILRWNFFLIVLCSNFDGVALYTSLELRTTDSGSIYSIISTVICILFNFIVFFTITKIFFIVRSLGKAKRQIGVYSVPNTTNVTQTVEESLKIPVYRKMWKNCTVVFHSFKDNSFSRHGFMVFYMIRIYSFDFVIGFFFEYPLLQAILITTMSVLMLAYLLLLRPFKEKWNLIELAINESIIFVVNTTVLALAITDRREECDEDNCNEFRDKAGEVIIMSNMVFSILAVFFICIEMVQKLIKACKMLRDSADKGLSLWVRIAMLAFEQDVMEFDEEVKKKKKFSRANRVSSDVTFSKKDMPRRDITKLFIDTRTSDSNIPNLHLERLRTEDDTSIKSPTANHLLQMSPFPSSKEDPPEGFLGRLKLRTQTEIQSPTFFVNSGGNTPLYSISPNRTPRKLAVSSNMLSPSNREQIPSAFEEEAKVEPREDVKSKAQFPSTFASLTLDVNFKSSLSKFYPHRPKDQTSANSLTGITNMPESPDTVGVQYYLGPSPKIKRSVKRNFSRKVIYPSGMEDQSGVTGASGIYKVNESNQESYVDSIQSLDGSKLNKMNLTADFVDENK